MLDIKKIVENRKEIENALLKRVRKEDLDIDSIIALYEKRKSTIQDFEEKRAQQNSFNDRVAQVQKGSDEFLNLIKELSEIKITVKNLEDSVRKIDEQLRKKLEILPNIPDDDVVAGGKENNEIIKIVGEKPTFNFDIKDHVALGTQLNLFDFERASKIAGSNFPMYTGMGARLEWALINYFVNEHIENGYQMIMPPHVAGEMSGYSAGQLPKFKNDVYWLDDVNQFLIPTAETVLTNIFRDEILEEKDLPQKLFAYTPCYRKEAGSYGANEKGLIRMHQFNKVEMYQLTTEDTSEDALEDLLLRAEDLVSNLGLHYRVSKLAAEDCSAAAAKTYDVEVWIPTINQYYEVSSISNVRDYQSRRGNIRYRLKDDDRIAYVHTLNASGLATSRLMVALVETYQQQDGSIVVPEVLRKYIGVDKIEK